MSGIFDNPSALSGTVASGSPFQEALSGVRTYSPGFRPSVAFRGLGALPAAATQALPGWVVALGAGAIALAVAGLFAYPLIGYYVGKKTGTKWGWFWGIGGPVGLAAMTGYRQYRGKIARPNRRRRSRRARSNRSPWAQRGGWALLWKEGDIVLVRGHGGGLERVGIMEARPDGTYTGVLLGPAQGSADVRVGKRTSFGHEQIAGDG